MDLYQENIPNLLISTDYYTRRKQELVQFIAENKKREKNGNTNMLEILATDRVKNIGESLAFTREILSRYDSSISKANRIINLIEKEYGE